MSDDFDFDFDSDFESEEDSDYSIETPNNKSIDVGDLNDFTAVDNTKVPHKGGQKNTFKIMIVCGISVFVLLMVALILYGKIKNNSNQSNTDTKTTEIPKSQVEKPNQSQTNTQANNSREAWVPIDKSSVTTLSDKIQGVFTITAIEHYVKTDSKGYQIKSVIKGNITGIIGEYEIYPNFSIASKAVVGNTFNVEYTTVSDNGKLFVTEIWW